MTENAPDRVNLLDLDEPGLRAFFASHHEKPFRSQQLMKWMYQHRVTDFDQMTDLSKSLRQTLKTVATVTLPEIISVKTSVDGTVKWLISTGKSGAIEMVFIPEDHRGTLCVSSQVGCALNCSFCSTGAQGFSRNLSVSEIIGQVLIAANHLDHRSDHRRITNVVMMGMGEPLLNFDAVVAAMSLMKHDHGFGFAGKRITLSTAGLVPAIDRLSDAIDVSLAISLHAPDNATRDILVPLNRKYPIPVLLEACRRYAAARHKFKVTFEYTMIKGMNDSVEQARALVRLLRTVPCKLNLIPFNPFPGTRYQCSSEQTIERFRRIVHDAGVVTTVRKTRGDDIDAACGQLAGNVVDRTRRSERLKQQAVAVRLPVDVVSEGAHP